VLTCVQEASRPKRKRLRRTNKEEGRRWLQCPFCALKYHGQLARHIRRLHKDKGARAKHYAKQAVAKGREATVIPEDLREILGEHIMEDETTYSKIQRFPTTFPNPFFPIAVFPNGLFS